MPQTVWSFGPSHRTFAFVPPWRYPKSFVAGSTADPGPPFWFAAAFGDVGE